jgi:methionyl-tRNA synthetase
MIKSYREGLVPSCEDSSSDLSRLAPEILSRVDDCMNNYAFDDALKAIWEFISRSNKFIDETMPWKLAKDANESGKLNHVLLNLYEALRLSAMLIAPFMPDTSEQIFSQLGLNESPLSLNYDAFKWGNGAGNRIGEAKVLFPRIDVAEWQKEYDAKQKAKEKGNMTETENKSEMTKKMPEAETKTQENAKTPEAETKPEITIDEFAKVEMRVARVINVEEIPRSKKLYKLELDLGYEKRTVCSGIKAFFTPEELTGKLVIVVTNLKPVKLCGVDSNGMVLAASVKHDGKAEVLTLLKPEDESIPLGSLVS